MLITADQIRAARALKNWSQTDLAERTGLAVPTIANIELGKQIPGKNTIEKIIDAFTLGKIRFTEHGVEFDKHDIFTITGDGKFKYILKEAMDLLNALPEKERVYYALNAEDHLTTEEEEELYHEMIDNGITLKRIVSQKSKTLHDYYKTKIAPHKYTNDKGEIFMFADKIVFYTYAGENRDVTTLIITNPQIVDTYKKTFEFMWDHIAEERRANPLRKKGRK